MLMRTWQANSPQTGEGRKGGGRLAIGYGCLRLIHRSDALGGLNAVTVYRYTLPAGTNSPS